jgi:hypothetical protein
MSGNDDRPVSARRPTSDSWNGCASSINRRGKRMELGRCGGCSPAKAWSAAAIGWLGSGGWRGASRCADGAMSARVQVHQHETPAIPNRLNQQFAVSAKNRVWTGDLTFVPTRTGWLTVAVLLDLYSRRIVGWAMSPNPVGGSRGVVDGLGAPTSGLGADPSQRPRQSLPGWALSHRARPTRSGPEHESQGAIATTMRRSRASSVRSRTSWCDIGSLPIRP